MAAAWPQARVSGGQAPPAAGVIGAGLMVAATATLAMTAVAGRGVAAAATASTAPRDGHRGQLVSVTPLRTLSGRAAVAAELTADGFDASSARRPCSAAGSSRLPPTPTPRPDSPPLTPTTWAWVPAGPGLHPWMDVPSETTAALDMLRAARHDVTGHGAALRRRVLVTGFSQEASAALGLGRALQDGAERWFRLGALAPISGAYDFRHAELPAVLGGELARLNLNPQLGAKYSVLYAACTLIGFNRVYPVCSSPWEVFRHYGSNVAGTAQIVCWFTRLARRR